MIHKKYNTAKQSRVENTDNKNAQNAQKKETKTMINLIEKTLIVLCMTFIYTSVIIGSALIIFLILT